ncbi:conserved hypothetical protein [uncultured Paludibacter sp.]|nr:conserved hypothetical protein [uncultured Paludibacter sp.]
MENTGKKEEICCPPFDPQPWEDKILVWENKKFIKSKVFTFFYIPVNFGGVMTKLMKVVEKNQVQTPDYLCLSDHTSKWNMDVYLAVDKEVPNVENIELSGKFYSRLYEGDFKKTSEWTEDFKKYAAEKNLEIEKWYMWYTTCPKCAKKYGKNYVVIIAKIK